MGQNKKLVLFEAVLNPRLKTESFCKDEIIQKFDNWRRFFLRKQKQKILKVIWQRLLIKKFRKI